MKLEQIPLGNLPDPIYVIFQNNKTNLLLDSKIITHQELVKNYINQENITLYQGEKIKIRKALINRQKDTLLLKVTSEKKNQKINPWGEENKKTNTLSFIDNLEKIIRKNIFYKNKKEDNSLSFLKQVINKTAQKLGEEATELIIEAKNKNNKKAFLNEAADLFFYYLILVYIKGFKLKNIIKILRKRNAQHKVIQKIENLKHKIFNK